MGRQGLSSLTGGIITMYTLPRKSLVIYVNKLKIFACLDQTNGHSYELTHVYPKFTY
jgi:hypothetical protein